MFQISRFKKSEYPTERGQSHFQNAADFLREGPPARPTFCFSRAAAGKALDAFRIGFPGRLSFAVKACPVPEYLKFLAESGLQHFDVASPEEMALVTAAAPHATLHYHNPIQTLEESSEAYSRYGCRRFAIDDGPGLDRLITALPQDAAVEIAVRISAPKAASLHDFSRKFGADEATAVKLLRRVKAHGHTPLLTFHPGSQCLDPAAYANLIETSARVSRTAGIQIPILNVGGGFPAHYEAPSPPPLRHFFDAISEALKLHFPESLPLLECEPGRALAASALSVLVAVKHRRTDGSLFLADGIYGSMMEMTQIPVVFPTRVWRNGKQLTGKMRDFPVYGPTCDPSDRLPQALSLPGDTDVGDVVEFGMVGGYGPSTVTRFNGYGHYDLITVQ